MKFGYTIIYVADVIAATKFYVDAFGFSTRFVHEGGDYAELETGETTLAFAAHSLGDANFPNGYTKLTNLPQPVGAEIAFVTGDVAVAVTNAVTAGSCIVSEATTKPWGNGGVYPCARRLPYRTLYARGRLNECTRKEGG